MNIKIYLHTAEAWDESERYEPRATVKYEGKDIDSKRQIIPERNGARRRESEPENSTK